MGAGVERCYALFDYAKSKGKEVNYLLAFARGVNAQGIHSDTDRGMQRIIEAAGLDWAETKPVLLREITSGDWRIWADDNYKGMLALGLWGESSFSYKGHAVWGKDRIDVIERRICESFD